MEMYAHFSKKFLVFSFLGICLFLIYIFLALSAPSDFPVSSIVSIDPGENLRHVSLELQQKHVIRSRTLFEAFVIMYGGEKHIIASDYFLESKLPVFEVARRISTGDRHLAPVVVTIPEGFNTNDIATTFAARLPHFNKDHFLLLAKGKEGYLFPDTYFFFTTSTESDVLQSISSNYEKKVAPLRAQIASSGRTERQIIIMASLIEREAKGDADRGIISGILWKRIKIGMPLQVDAAPETYKTKGLPTGPIANPGVSSILAAINPIPSQYFYYLHDINGVVHYAVTFREHQKNISKYLK